MRILIVSDTHGNASRAFAAHTLSEPVDAIIHLGDGSADADLLRDILDIQVVSVAGNCDSGSNAPRELLWECEGKRILLTHGDVYQVKSGVAKLRQRAREVGADAALFGHTHQLFLENHDGLVLLNPGSLANSTLHRSYAVLNITSEGISCLHHELN